MNKIKQIYEEIKLDENDKIRLFNNIKENAFKERKKKNVFLITKTVGIVAVCACTMIIITNSAFQVKAGEYIKNVVNWITGNSKDDYLEEPNIVVSNNNMQLEIKSAKRVNSEVRVMYELVFPDSIEKYINLENYRDNIYNFKEIFCSDIFTDCKIYVNDKCINDVYKKDYIEDREFYSCMVKDIEVRNNVLVQELILNLNEEYLNSDLNFTFEYNKININNTIIEANLKTKYLLQNNLYKDDIQITYIPEYKVNINKNKYNFYGYSYTKTGIKIYCKEEFIDTDSYIIYLRVTDNYGTKYLFYPIYYQNNDEGIYVFQIYDGPADLYNEYVDNLKTDITNIKIEVMTETDKINRKGESNSEKIGEFDINFVK